MYQIHQSNKLSSLVYEHSEIFISESPLEDNVKIVVQNTGLGEWLIQQLTLKLGVVLGPDIMMPEQALRYFAEGFDSVHERLTHDGEEKIIGGVLYLDSLRIIVYKALLKALETNEPEYNNLKHYVGKKGAERLWPLADSVAGIFYHYGMNCPELLEKWEKDRLINTPSSPKYGEEVWQFRLWKNIFGEMGYVHLSRLLSDVIDKNEPFRGSPCRIILFGSMFLGETGLNFFHHLSQQMDVYHFILSPSKVFGSDGSGKSGKSGKQAGELPRFLENNCRLFEGFNKIINKLEIQNVKSTWKSPQTDPPSLLHKLQNSLLEGDEINQELPDDGSLEIHEISGARRTVEVLKDRILQALRDDPFLRTIDIGVLAPDINLYAPHIEVIFPMGTPSERLEYNLIDLPAISHSSYQSAFKQIMELPGSHFGRNSLLALFENPCFAPCLRNPGLKEKLHEIVDNLNIRWGLDREHRKEEGIFHGLSGSWELGFKRILAGYFHSGDDLDELKPSSNRSDTNEMGTIIHTLRGLDEDFRQIHLRCMTLREWILNWEKKTEKWLRSEPSKPTGNGLENISERDSGGNILGGSHRHNSANNDHDRLNIKSMFRNLMSLNTQVKDLSNFADNTLPWTVFKSLLEDSLDSFNGHRGHYLTRGVTGSSLKPMRAIPFRRIYLLGMDEGAWPGQEMLPDFDLRDSVPRLIDLSRESVDRFAFMETILSAEEHLSFFTSGKDAAGTDIIPPASSLEELLDYLGKESKMLVSNHPISCCDTRAFTGKGKIATCSSRAFALARAITSDAEQKSACTSIQQRIPNSETTKPEIQWGDIESFLKNPVGYFFNQRLGVKLTKGKEEISEDDPLEPQFLDWWLFRQRAVVQEPGLLNDSDDFLRRFSRKLWLESRLADIPLSGIGLEKLRNDVRVLTQGVNSLREDGLDMDEIFLCRLLKTLPLRLSSMDRVVVELPAADSFQMVNVQAPFIPSTPGEGSPGSWVLGTIPGLHRMKPEGQDGKETWCMVEYASNTNLRNRIRSWLAALLIGSVINNARTKNPGTESPGFATSKVADLPTWRLPEEFRVYSVGVNEGFLLKRYYYQPSSPSLAKGSEGREIIDMSKAASLLNEVLQVMQLAETEPLCLYPVLAGLMLKTEGIREISRNPEKLAHLASECWNELLGNPSSKGAYYFINCPYRETFLKEPNFSSPLFHRTWKLLYLNGGLG